MSNFEATKELKQGPDGINIEPWPNPKPLSVERVSVNSLKGDGTDTSFPSTEGFIRNAKLHPDALLGRW
jgi:hypothetical protein